MSEEKNRQKTMVNSKRLCIFAHELITKKPRNIRICY